ncbi:hypothetical protein EKO04_006760 [Ascochyta lentis]|uniref:Uncharacterized protein n=1 Tax=Ascochyta lentis TaxID=205686 RepID=A0A8H7IZI6_9PLEO|nr:hypothetical protein EKO04_006760 [Ascochyta lentis]
MGQNFTIFDVEYECRNKSTPLNCNLTWENAGDVLNLTKLGATKYGEFEADGDLAGDALLASFVVPTAVSLSICVSLVLSLWMYRFDSPKIKRYTPSPGGAKRRRQRQEARIGAATPPDAQPKNELSYDILETILVAMADYQIIFGAALCVYFNVIGKCGVSMYHFNMGLNLLIVICGNTLLTLVIMRSFWAAPVSSLARLVAIGLLLFYQGKILWIQHARNQSFGMAEALPTTERNSSLILLQAACFLDPRALGNLTSQLYDDDATIKTARINVVGDLNHDGKKSVELYIWFFLVFCFAAVVVYQLAALLKACCRRKLKSGEYAPVTKKHRGCLHTSRLFLCTLTLLLSSVVCIWRIMYLYSLKGWVSESGWMKEDAYLGNEESGISSFGQAAALCTAIGFVFVAAERIEWKRARS